MEIFKNIFVSLVGVFHVGFMILEMFLWRSKLGLKIFRINREFADSSASLAANQGLYNGFLAAGIFWGLLMRDPVVSRSVLTFFLTCVTIAGLFGGLTVSKRILYIQALPAVSALGFLWLNTQ